MLSYFALELRDVNGADEGATNKQNHQLLEMPALGH
mgnify:CR=1 FL=1